MPSPDLSDYVTVAQRIVAFRDKYPGGSLRPLDPAKPYTIERIGDLTMIVVVAAAYRSPEDALPGVGMAAEPFPGRTPYTRGSELMNAETSAWGRAIVAALAADTSLAIASKEEVENRRHEEPLPDYEGKMTDQERREHNALRRNAPTKGERARGPVPESEDVWTDQPAGAWSDATPEDKPGTSNSRQWQALAIVYPQAGIAKDRWHADLTDRTGRKITSAKDLSYNEAEEIHRALEVMAKERSGK